MKIVIVSVLSLFFIYLFISAASSLDSPQILRSVNCEEDDDCPSDTYCNLENNKCEKDLNAGIDETRLENLDIGSDCEINEECNTNICARTTYYGDKKCVVQSCACTSENTNCEQGIEYSSEYNNGALC